MNQFELTESILKFWKENESFAKSIETRSDQMQWKFYDGPPFTSGDPHYGHLLQSTVKDMVPRWMTMRGYRVDRKRWWDCHGIPAENFVNKKLWITSKRQVEEEFGLQKYIEECRTMVWDVNDNRKRFVDHLWRRVDMDNAYFTMNNEYMESVIHLFADLYHNNLIYKWFKVLGYSRALGTALSNSEIAEWYMDRQDPAVTVKLKLKAKSEKLKALREKYEVTDDGYVHCAVGLVENEWKYLMVYDTKFWSWFFPGWKVDAWETIEQAAIREVKEEINLETIKGEYVWSINIPQGRTCWSLDYVKCEVVWDIKNNEPEKQSSIAWIDFIESENDLWFAVRIDAIDQEWTNIIDDVDQIFNDFWDYLLVKNKFYEVEWMTTADVSLLARTTTPRTLPSNMFGAVNADSEKNIYYAQVFDLKTKEHYILAESLLNKYYKDKDDYIYIHRLKWDDLIWLDYEPLFDYYYKSKDIDTSYHDKVHTILHADFVTEDSGTGIAHEAPAFGEDDYNLVVSLLGEEKSSLQPSPAEREDFLMFPPEKAQERLFNPVNDHGEFTDEVPDFAGRNVIETNKDVIKHLKERGLLVKQETINHSYPHCPRTKEPIIYRAMESWFVKEKELTEKTLPLAEQINFVPPQIKKRFTNGLATAPDRNISRTRFRWAPLPVWECEDENCEERKVFGSIAEIAEVSGQKVTDLHRPYIDEITVPCSCGKMMRRIPEVLDCWFDSGSMPYWQDHFMKADQKWEKRNEKKEIVLPDGYTLIDDLPESRREEYKALRLESITSEPDAFGTIVESSGVSEKYSVESKFSTDKWLERLNTGYTIFVEFEWKLVWLMWAVKHNEESNAWFIMQVFLEEDHRWKWLAGIMLDKCIDYLLVTRWFEKIILRVRQSEKTLSTMKLYESRLFNFVWVETEEIYWEFVDLKRYELYNSKKKQFSTTADFIAEWLDQTRGWFRSLHVLGAAYTDNIVYRNVVITWLILAEDGKKMSKSLKNYPDPRWLFEKYGADAFRLYVLGSPVVKAEPLRFAEQWVEQVLKDFVIPLQNVWNFFKMYAEVDQWKDDGTEVYFMRHAEKEKIEKKDIEIWLNEDWFNQIKSKEFVEKVLRIDPDVIIASPSLRTQQTAVWAQKCLKDFINKEVEVIEDGRLFDWKDIGYFLDEIKDQGKKVLLVSHDSIYRKIRPHLLWIDGWSIWYWEIIKLPTTLIHNEIDQWILSELYTMMWEMDQKLAWYELEPATKLLMWFMDKLTNRWLRRSRRRFRAEWMTEDKQAVYWTLREVLSIYLKLAAPFAPFVTEWVWQEMNAFKAKNWKLKTESIHLEYRPLHSDKYVNQELSDEIAEVRKIIKWAMYLRAKHQIKVKQPLQELRFKV